MGLNKITCTLCNIMYAKKRRNFYCTTVRNKRYYRKQCIKCFLKMNNKRYYKAKETKAWANTGHKDRG